MDDMYAVPTPRIVVWPDAAELLVGLVDVFDWDSVYLKGSGLKNASNILITQIPLCTRGLPCVLDVFGGSPAAELRFTGQGEILCSAPSGCVSVSLNGIVVECDTYLANQAPVRVDGTTLIITNCCFNGCSSRTNGGSIQALEAQVTMSYSKFFNSSSLGPGGALSLVGTTANLTDCFFLDCFSFESGGAISSQSCVTPGPRRQPNSNLNLS